jgi:hypothetical protein
MNGYRRLALLVHLARAGVATALSIDLVFQ